MNLHFIVTQPLNTFAPYNLSTYWNTVNMLILHAETTKLNIVAYLLRAIKLSSSYREFMTRLACNISYVTTS